MPSRHHPFPSQRAYNPGAEEREVGHVIDVKHIEASDQQLQRSQAEQNSLEH
jgi:hypothetical protein